jgi:hypothetical protein
VVKYFEVFLSTKPWNLIFRFLLETAGLVALADFGYHLSTSNLRYLLMVALPLGAAAIWGAFAVPNDPTRRPGPVLVPIPGPLRLVLELAYFGLAIYGLFRSSAVTLGWIFAALVLFHYAISWDRVAWLLSNKPFPKQNQIKQR